MAYTEFDYRILVKQLRQCADKEYKNFQSGLSMGASYMYGVRVPELRKIARRIIPKDWKGYLSVAKDNSYEEILIQGLVISEVNCPIEEQLVYIAQFMDKIDNWAVCDIFCCNFKAAKRFPDIVWEFLMNYVESQGEFKKRFVIVMMMEHFLTDEYIDRVLDVLLKINKEEHYVVMAAAWAISSAFVKFREKTLSMLESGELDERTFKKAIQKCRESYRVTAEDKAVLKQLMQQVD